MTGFSLIAAIQGILRSSKTTQMFLYIHGKKCMHCYLVCTNNNKIRIR